MTSIAARRLSLWGPPIAYMCWIFFLSSESDPLPALTRLFWDKSLHGTGYAALGALLVRAIAGEGAGWKRAWLLAAVGASIYGATDEFHQAFVAGRDSDVFDWVADTVGALIGSAVFVAALAVWHGQIVKRWPAVARLNGLVGTRAQPR